MNINIADLSALSTAADQFIKSIGKHRVVAFKAPMGGGKTTFIAEVCRHLGVDETANSPSFSIVNEYRDAENNKIYHFDFYRLKSAQEATDIGAEDYFYSGNLCLIEWPERVNDILPDDTLFVNITVNDDDSRTISL